MAIMLRNLEPVTPEQPYIFITETSFQKKAQDYKTVILSPPP